MRPEIGIAIALVADKGTADPIIVQTRHIGVMALAIGLLLPVKQFFARSRRSDSDGIVLLICLTRGQASVIQTDGRADGSPSTPRLSRSFGTHGYTRSQKASGRPAWKLMRENFHRFGLGRQTEVIIVRQPNPGLVVVFDGYDQFHISRIRKRMN